MKGEYVVSNAGVEVARSRSLMEAVQMAKMATAGEPAAAMSIELMIGTMGDLRAHLAGNTVKYILKAVR